MVQRLFVTVSCVFGVRGARCKSFFGVQGATKHSQRVCHSQYPSTERVVLVLRFASSICVMSLHHIVIDPPSYEKGLPPQPRL